ncbi:MAG: type II secretion system F family protein [Clostridia bacterium]|nr:type II secretion system F family protein [Clostridia bacterium]
MIRDYSIYEMTDRERTLFFSAGYLAAAALMFLFYRSLILSAACGFLIVKLKPYYSSYRAKERIQKLNIQFKDMLYSLSSSIAAGRQMPQALVEAADSLAVMYGPKEPIMMELNHMKRCIVENNESDRELLADFARRSCCEDINNFVQVYIICRNMGGDLEKIIARTSAILTDKMNIEREIKALTAQKKFEGRLIALMPVAMLVILNLLSPSYIVPLYAGLPGRLIMTGCLGAGLWGLMMMERLSNVDI